MAKGSGKGNISSILSQLTDIVGVESPVDFKTFVTHPDYCNNNAMYQYWLDQGQSMTGKQINELILSGSLGNGKSWYASYWSAYWVYCLFLAGSPQIQLGLASDAELTGLYFSVSLSMAKKSGFLYLYNIFAGSPWFRNNAPINTNLKSSIEFIDKHFSIEFCSTFSHQIGLNVPLFILDEANFRGGVGSGVAEQYEEVTELYTQLLDRQISRFARPDGGTNALAILISSASYQSAFSEKRIQAVKDNPRAKVISSAAFEVKPQNFSKEKFKVFIGAGSIEPCIIESEDQKNRVLHSANLDGFEDQYIKEVPVNLLPAFKENIVLSLQNHVGIPTNMSSSFMPNMKYLYDSYVDDINDVLQAFDLEASTGDDTELCEYWLYGNEQYADLPHSLHLDLATGSIGSDNGCLVLTRSDGPNNEGVNVHTKVFALRIKGPQFPYKTKIEKVKRFILFIASRVNLVAFSSDNYQSVGLRQEVCDELGLENIRISLDSSDVPYILWVRALIDGRIRQARSANLEKEVQEAIHDHKRHRVLKSDKSSDDELQATVASFFLSDTVGTQFGSVSDLYSGRETNLLGSKSFQKFLHDAGYKQY